jgi:nicotinamidase-related amidase
MKPALIVIDMLNDTFDKHRETPLVQAAARHTKER